MKTLPAYLLGVLVLSGLILLPGCLTEGPTAPEVTLSEAPTLSLQKSDDDDDDAEEEGEEEVEVCASDADAFQTFQEAVAAVAPGGTIEVCPGTYTEAFVIDKGLTIEGDEDQQPTLAPPPNSPPAIEVTTPDRVVIRGLVIGQDLPCCPGSIRGRGLTDITVEETTFLGGSIGVAIFNDAAETGGRARLVVRNSTFDGAISVFAVTDVDALIEGNVVRRTGFSCIQVQGRANAQVIDNDVDECGTHGGIRAANMSAASEVFISRNTVRNSTATNRSSYGIIWWGGGSGGVELNSVLDYVQPGAVPRSAGSFPRLEAAGIHIAEGATPSVRFNDISGNAQAGLRATRTTTIDATCNWWGSTDGPSGDGAGSGDAVIGTAEFIPFATAPIAQADDDDIEDLCGEGDDTSSMRGTRLPMRLPSFLGQQPYTQPHKSQVQNIRSSPQPLLR